MFDYSKEEIEKAIEILEGLAVPIAAEPYFDMAIDSLKDRQKWQELKDTITELRDSDGTLTQQEVCQFLVRYMDVLEDKEK